MNVPNVGPIFRRHLMNVHDGAVSCGRMTDLHDGAARRRYAVGVLYDALCRVARANGFDIGVPLERPESA